MICPDCNERKAVFTSLVIDRVRRCAECDQVKRDEAGIVREGFGKMGKFTSKFEPYWCRNGNFRAIKDSADYNKEERAVYIKSAAHEDAVMKAMDCHIGEVGEDLMGHKIGDKPDIDLGEKK